VGVDVFYVLSGFLITGLLWREVWQTGRLSFASFYASRARRLLPAAMLVVVATVVASTLWLSPLRAEVVTKDAIASALYVGNYRFAALRSNYLASDAPPSPLQHY
jgi:peptidoglycan/LPS O-acetylase OafA/YrhL